MKKRVGILNGTPIVEGDPNLLSNKELLHKGGGSLAKRTIDGKVEDLGGGSGSAEFKYYKFVNTNANYFPVLLELVMYIPIIGIHFILGDMDVVGDVLVISGTSSSSFQTPGLLLAQGAEQIVSGEAKVAFKISTAPHTISLTFNNKITILEVISGDLFTKIKYAMTQRGSNSEDLAQVLELLYQHVIPITEEEYLNFNGE